MDFTRVRANSRSEHSSSGQAILGQPPADRGPRECRRRFGVHSRGPRWARVAAAIEQPAARSAAQDIALHLILDRPASDAALLLVHRRRSDEGEDRPSRDARVSSL